MLKQTHITGLIGMIMLTSTVLSAADTATVLAPVLDDQTFAVVRIKMTRDQLDAITQDILGSVKKHAGPEVAAAIQTELQTFTTNTGQRLQALEKTGASALYGVFSLRTLPDFLVVAPTQRNPEPLIPIMKQIARNFEVKVLTNPNNPTLVVAGSPPAIAQLAHITPTRPQGLAEAVATCHDTSTVHLALAPSPDLSVIVKQMLPQVPLGSGSIPLGSLVDTLQWGAVDLHAPPQTALRVTTHSPDDTSAGQLSAGIQAVYTLIKQMPQVRNTIPGIDALFRHLIPTQQGTRLSITVDRTNTETIVKEAMAASLMSIRRKRMQYACGSTVSDLGRAVLIYSNDHNDELPHTLEDLRETDLRERGIQCPAVKTKDSYVYRGKGLNCSHSLDMIVLYDKRANHNGTNHRNVLFLDTRVEWITEERFQELIRQDNAYRRKKGMPELPAE